MIQPLSSQQVVCRPALARDHADVTEFCKDIWDGDDYVPDAWEDWLKDPNGLLAVAESDGHAIGCSKITLISKGQWWLEGFRVDPKYQGLKVGSRLHKYVTDWWIENADGILRLMTDAGNFAVHQVCLKTGYVKTHEVCGYKAMPIAEPADHFSPVTDLREAATFAHMSESIKSTDGLTDFGWRIAMPDELTLEAYSGDKADYLHTFYWWKDKQGLFSAWANEEEDLRTLVIGVVACALKDMPALLMDARRLAAHEKFDGLFQIPFDMPQIISQLEAAGFEKKWKRSNAFLFEKKHPSKA
ncbi:MAG TPA: GNAT family N-acetyltransferase, partial [Anaerolineales bacterium]|nr:GNAT family N-acetyltransferase [Anaerolineales bacterium]